VAYEKGEIYLINTILKFFFSWYNTAMYCIQQFWYICEILGSPNGVASDSGVWVKTLWRLVNDSRRFEKS
jgi:hypothetical protein